MNEIKIIQVQSFHQQSIDEMMAEIAEEFAENFTLPGSKSITEVAQLPGSKYWVAINGDLVVGTVGIISGKNYGVLKRMMVRKAFRGKDKGVSDLLLRTAILWCKKNNLPTIYLGTMGQFKGAQKFYEKKGFHKIPKGKLPVDYPDNPIDTLFYQLDLMDELKYRKGAPEDIEQLHAVRMISYGQYASLLTPENQAILKKRLEDKNVLIELMHEARAFVCENGKEIIGMALLVPHGKPSPIFQPEWCQIRLVGVHPDYEGRGIAKTLTKMCIDHAIKTKEKTIALHTSEFMDAARHIYESLGFKKLKEIDPIFGKKYWLYTLDI